MQEPTPTPTPLPPDARWAAVILLGAIGLVGVAQGVLAPNLSSINAASQHSDPASNSTPQLANTPDAINAPAMPKPEPTTSSPTRLININTATAAELDLLPGIGPALAGRIIDYRKVNGPYASLDDLDDVSGIGPKTIAKMVPYATAE